MSPKILCAILALAVLANSSHAAPAKTPMAANPQIDARGVAALDKSIAFYKKQRSFSFAATETVMLKKVVYRRARIEASLQTPARASLKITDIEANGKMGSPLASRLLNAKSYIASQLEMPAESQPIATAQAREEAIAQMFAVLPSVEMSVVALSRGENPMSNSSVKSVGYAEIRQGKRLLKNVIMVRKSPLDVAPIRVEFRLAPQTFAVEEIVFYGEGAGGKFVVVTRFDPLQSNWRGSQSATDAAVYNWQKLAPRIPIEPRVASKPSRAEAVAQINPKARAVFARAVGLYREIDGLRVAYTEIQEGERSKGSFSFDRAGRVRIVSTEPFGVEALKIIDGKTEWTLDESRMNDAEAVLYTRETLKEGSAPESALTALRLSFNVAGAFIPWLTNVNSLDADGAENRAGAGEVNEFRASLLPPQPFGGQPCERVRITMRGFITAQQTYWFARGDGRLMRYQERELEGNVEVVARDWQITAQEFNPTFAPDTFKFVPPKGAKLSND